MTLSLKYFFIINAMYEFVNFKIKLKNRIIQINYLTQVMNIEKPIKSNRHQPHLSIESKKCISYLKNSIANENIRNSIAKTPHVKYHNNLENKENNTPPINLSSLARNNFYS